MVILLVVMKIIWRRKPVELSRKRADLQRAIEALRAPKQERKQRTHQSPPAEDVNRLEELTQDPTEVGPMNAGPTLLRPTLSSRNELLNAQVSESGADTSLGGSSSAYRD